MIKQILLDMLLKIAILLLPVIGYQFLVMYPGGLGFFMNFAALFIDVQLLNFWKRYI